MKKLILMDGNSIANRAFYALPPLTNGKGEYTHAVYGFTMMLLRVLEEEKPTHLLIAFDAGKEVFRHQTYEAYKGTRQKSPDELKEQFPRLKEIVDAFRIRRLEKEGYEADDLIGTISLLAEREGLSTKILTGDKDFLQLISDHIEVGLTRKGISEIEWFNRESLREKMGLTPAQIIDLKGLMGDSSDNIPGIPGVGEKTALKFLQQYGSVEGLLDHLHELKGKMKEKVEENRQLALLSKDLATIRRDVPIEIDVNELAWSGYDYSAVRALFLELDFRSLLDRIHPSVMAYERPAPEGNLSISAAQGDEGGGAENDATGYHLLQAEKLQEGETYLTPKAALHVELDGLNPHRSSVLAISIASEKGVLLVPPSLAKKWEPFRHWLEDEKMEKWLFDGKQGEIALAYLGFFMKGITYDALLAAYLLDPTSPPTEVAGIARKGGLHLPEDEEIYGKGAKWRLPEEQVLYKHAAEKASVLWKTHDLIIRELHEKDLLSLYLQLELPLSRVLAKMEWIGIRVDRERLWSMGEELDQELEKTTKEIYRLAGTEFNINSTKQLGEILYEKLGLPPLKKTKTGYSTDADTLEKLQDYHEIIPILLHYRMLGKLKFTYIEGLMKEIDERDGKIHTTFNQALTATGRLSSNEPNLQNIPIRVEEGRRIRQAFIPSEPGWKILSSDYSQIELRVLAHISQDENLIAAFQKGLDIHTATAMEVFGVGEGEVTPRMRRQAKAVNFGIVYGISDYGLSQNLNISRKEAADFIERYFSVYRGVKRYMEEIVAQARKQGYVTTLLNRRRELPEILDRNFNRRSFAERTAMNTPIQGTAADIIKKAMILLDEEMKRQRVRSRMLLQVHDELVFEVPEEELEQMTEMVRRIMENAMELSVPLRVDIHHGLTWYDAK
ncbi:DNA polymerase I [[Clostridium] ultunense Esp]|nr:DNA polymerase I [[Clostridium] ultunense Esp]